MAERTPLTVNGAARTLDCAPDTPLVYVLRNDLQLKGTRFGCGTGHCGACTVLVDGKPVQSCDVPLWSAAGKEVTTIEGLAAQKHPLLDAFTAEQALQCGYCISGVVMSAAALLASNRDPSEAQIAAALDRHLCRCGTHVRIVRAIRRAAKASP
jgi:nicotinate dehydrogenase subunit A